MKKTILLFSLFVFSCSFSNGQSWLWGKEGMIVGLKPSLSPENVATDVAGNAFITGSYNPGVIFLPDTLIDSAVGYNDETYFVKYNSSGNVVWAKQFIGYSYISNPYICTDVSNNVIITGEFYSYLDIGSFHLTGNGYCFFVTKCDNNGIPLWAIAVNDSLGDATATWVTTDKFKNIFITGVFSGFLKFGATTLYTSDTTYSIFTAKYDSNGNVLWVRMGKCISHISNYADESYSVTTDLSGNSIITGSYIDSIAFGPDTLVSQVLSYFGDARDLFIVKYDSVGNLIWAKQSVIPSLTSIALGYAITTDNAGSIYVSGEYYDTVSFGPYTLTGAGPYIKQIFLTKYNSNGKLMWVKGANSPRYGAIELSSDEFNNIYMSGWGGGGSNDYINFGSYTLYSTKNDGYNAFILKFDTSGNVLCGSMLLNGIHQNYSAVDKSGKYVYEVGEHMDTVFCAQDTLITHGSNQDCYVARWQNCGTLDATNSIQSLSTSVSVFPNPSKGQFTIALSHAELVSASQTVTIYNILGEAVYVATLKQVQGDYTLDLSAQPNGIYLYRVLNEDGSLLGSGKVIIQK